jgi:polysaccharide deacetylase 2 family uncharacterized protein YibQ
MTDRKKGGARGKAPAPKKKVSIKKAPAKKAPAKKKGTRKKQKPDIGKELKKIFLGIAILLAICLTVAMIADIFIFSGQKKSDREPSKSMTQTDKKSSAKPKENKNQTPVFEDSSDIGVGDVHNKKPSAGLREKPRQSILYEVFEDLDQGQVEKKPILPKTGDDTPRIAIIIDDIGYDRQIAMALYQLDSNLTFSVLPFSPFGSSIARSLSAKGAQLMLHLPMEPLQYPEVNPGQGALLSAMTPDILLSQLRKDLKQVPGVVGVNNHMGSKLTADSDKMNQVFTILKNEDLFFIDSRTSPISQGEASARLFNLRFAQRDVFLDNNQNIPYITGQFAELIRIAEKHGTAIGIGHPYAATLETLKIELPKLKGKIRIIPASQLVTVPE